MRWVIALLLALAPAAAMAGAPADQMREIRAGEAVTIQPDKAYILLRTYRPKGTPNIEPLFLRVPDDAEMDAYIAARNAAFREAEPQLIAARVKALAKAERAKAQGKAGREAIPPVPTVDNFNFVWKGHANVENVESKHAFVDADPVRTYLIEAPSGQYVLYGASYRGGLRIALHGCFCLGSVSFVAKAGTIVDLGFVLIDQAKTRAAIPEVAVESGFGPSSDPFLPLIAGTVRPVTAKDPVPAEIKRFTIEPADYRAVGKFFHPGASGINRLIPVPGVLAYDGGKVIDVKSGQVAIDRH